MKIAWASVFHLKVQLIYRDIEIEIVTYIDIYIYKEIDTVSAKKTAQFLS